MNDTKLFFSSGDSSNAFFQRETYHSAVSPIGKESSCDSYKNDTLWKLPFFPSIPYVPPRTFENETTECQLIQSMNVSFTSLSTFFDDYYQHQYDSQFQAIYVPTTPLIEIHEDSSDSTNEESDITVVDELLETSNKSILNYIEKMIQQSIVDQLFSPSV